MGRNIRGVEPGEGQMGNVGLASSGEAEKALPIFKRVFAREPIWAELVPRLVRSELLPDDPKLIEKILAQAPEN